MSSSNKKWIVSGVILLVLGVLGYVGYGIFSERTIIPATDPSEETVTGKTESNTIIQTDSSSSQDTSIVHKAEEKGGNIAPKNTSVENTSEVAVAGRQLAPSDFHINHKLNARMRFTNFYNTFKEGDYVTGSDLAVLYGNDKEINTVVRKIIVKYLQEHIDYIQKRNGEIVINTVDEKPAVTKVYVPLLIDLTLTVKHGSRLVFGKTFVAKEKDFAKLWMLPIQMKGIEVHRSDGNIPESGYVSGDNYYVNYSSTLDCYKLK